jgi:hypothetical protein
MTERLSFSQVRRIPAAFSDFPEQPHGGYRLTPPAARCGGPGSLSQTGAAVPYQDRLSSRG